MSATDDALDVQDFMSDALPTALLSNCNDEKIESLPKLIGLRAHAAVCFLDADMGNYDSHDIPVPASSQKGGSRFSLGRSFRSVTAYLSSKNRPSFQESDISIEGDTPVSASFVVRGILHAGKANARPGDIIARYPLNRLVDISGYSVFEKDSFAFKHLPPVLSPEEEGAIAKSLPCSSLYSSHSGVGMHLVFRDPGSFSSSARDQYRKVEIHFVSFAERGIWLCGLEKVYTELLLDSIRTGEDARFASTDMRRLVEESTRLLQSRPPPAVLERHIDFFLSSAGRETVEQSEEPAPVDLSDVPCGGTIRIGTGDGKYETRRLAHKGAAKHTASSESMERGYLVMRPTTLSQHVRMVPKLKVPVSQLRVVVEEEHWGNSFFLERTGGAKTHGESLLRVCHKQVHRFHKSVADASNVGLPCSNGIISNTLNNSSGGEMNGTGNNFVITEILEMQTNSFLHRIKWLKWFEALTGKSTVYISRMREGKKGNRKSRSSLRHASSLFPNSNVSGEPGFERQDDDEEE